MNRLQPYSLPYLLMGLLALGLKPLPGEAAESGVIESRDQLLEGEEAEGQVGDVRLADEHAVYIFSAPDHPLFRETTGGALIDVAVGGTGADRLGMFATAYGPNLMFTPRNTAVRASEDGRAVIVEGVDKEREGITVRTEYRLDSEHPGLIITSELVNGTDASLEDWCLGDIVQWGSALFFVMERGMVFQTGLQTSAECVGGVGDDICLMYVRDGGAPIEVLHRADVTRLMDAPVDIGPGESVTSVRHLLVGTGSMASVADSIWALLGRRTGTLRGQVVDQSTAEGIAGAEVLINERGAPPKPLLRVLTDEEGRFSVSLPAGVSVTGFAHSYTRSLPTQTVAPVTIQPGEEAFQQYLLTPPAQIDLRVTDEETGELLPVRVALYDLQGRPATLGPIQSGEVGGPYIFATTGEGIYQVPPSRFRMTISHGPEYSRHEQEVIFLAGTTRQFHLSLRRLVDTSGYVAADLGVLTTHSHGAMVSPLDRARTAVTEGLEFLVTTDHGTVTDLAAALQEADVDLPLTVARGERILAPDSSPEGDQVGSWAVFPLPEDLAGRSAFAGATFSSHREVLRRLRERFPEALIAALNPTREGQSPFLHMGYHYDPMDRKYHPPAQPATAEDCDFDLFEVFSDRDLGRMRHNLDLYYELLREGHRLTAIGSANSRFAGLEEIGYPRTYVAANDADPRAIDPAEVFASLRAGNAVVTTGPWIEFSILDQPIGSMILWEPGEPIEIDLRVVCPRWMQLAYVDVCKEGVFVSRRTFLEPAEGPVYDWRPEEGRNRYMVRSDHIFTVEVKGRQPLSPMNPLNLMPQPFEPWAMTNPIWIDTDGNGRFDAFQPE